MVTVTVAIDTEEDDWGSYEAEGASTENIAHLEEVQERFDQFGVRPTYLVNRPPLVDAQSVEVLGRLAQRPEVEIGTHCHPWNTPPFEGTDARTSMMSALPLEANRSKIREVTGRIERELGVTPRSFRAGRWGFGPTVAEALVAEGYRIDASVSPLIDWSPIGGPDFTQAPLFPYRCEPHAPLEPRSHGRLLELPTTVGFLRGTATRRNQARRALEKSPLARLKVVGLLDRAGVLARRWLSPETSSGTEMVKLADTLVSQGATFLSMTFHSCTVLPGATPFVRDKGDRSAFLREMAIFLRHCRESGFEFRTLSETAEHLYGEPSSLSAKHAR